MSSTVRNVEEYNYIRKQGFLGCLCCNKGRIATNDILKFKSLNDFFIYFEYQFGKYSIDTNIEALKNYESYINFKENLISAYGDISYIFKVNRFICKKCFAFWVTQSTGFNKLFKSLNVNIKVLKNNFEMKKKEREMNQRKVEEQKKKETERIKRKYTKISVTKEKIRQIQKSN